MTSIRSINFSPGDLVCVELPTWLDEVELDLRPTAMGPWDCGKVHDGDLGIVICRAKAPMKASLVLFSRGMQLGWVPINRLGLAEAGFSRLVPF